MLSFVPIGHVIFYNIPGAAHAGERWPKLVPDMIVATLSARELETDQAGSKMNVWWYRQLANRKKHWLEKNEISIIMKYQNLPECMDLHDTPTSKVETSTEARLTLSY